MISRPIPVLLIFLLILLSMSACDPGTAGRPENTLADPSRDHFTFANLEQFQTTHLELELEVDFSQQRLSGHVIHYVNRLDATAGVIVLDSRGLEISAVQYQDRSRLYRDLEFRLGPTDPVRGEALEILLPWESQAADDFLLKIDYRSGPEASALMWLPAELTAGGEHPFMFTQSQSIHARSWVPLQDSPSVRVTYDAIIRTPPHLQAVMSAENQPGSSPDGEHRFRMPQPIPSYLLALAVGNLVFEPLGEDTGVYAEPEILPAAAREFADTQAMLDTAEAIYGPYRWGRYDLLIMPPSFSYGGMENPRLSFITPSVIAGDRSLVSMIAHELAHSWSGNLVSNRSWRDIWLNEGTTSYVEARIMEAVYGKERADEERLLMYKLVLESIEIAPPERQALAPLVRFGRPDNGPYGIQYGKGELLLEHLEAVFGRAVFDSFMAGYFDHFAFQAISSEQFLDYIDENLLQQHPALFRREDLEVWLYQPGLPEPYTVPYSANLDEAGSLAAAWAAGELSASALPAERWSPQAVVWFIEALPAELAAERLAELDAALGLSHNGNSEIARSWFIQVAHRRYQPAYPMMQSYLGRYGRTRLIKPVYAALVENGLDARLAADVFRKESANYHPLTIAAIEPLFDKGAEGLPE